MSGNTPECQAKKLLAQARAEMIQSLAAVIEKELSGDCSFVFHTDGNGSVKLKIERSHHVQIS